MAENTFLVGGIIILILLFLPFWWHRFVLKLKEIKNWTFIEFKIDLGNTYIQTWTIECIMLADAYGVVLRVAAATAVCLHNSICCFRQGLDR